MTIEEIKVGQRVHYAPSHGKKENGIVKSITEHAVFVVYKCGGEWDHYQDYTGQNTPIEDLYPGWTTEKETRATF
jgi:hypothetical protein